MKAFTGIVIVLAVALAPLTDAQPSINVGRHNLLPNTSGQTIEVFVTGGQSIEALNLNVQINEGVDATGPAIESVDAITGTIFAPPNNDGGQFDTPTGYPHIFITTVTTPFGTSVNADGLLATITLDTTGLFSGTYDLKLADTANGNTNLGPESNSNDPIVPTTINGQVTIVPEPASALLLAAGGVILVVRRRRDR